MPSSLANQTATVVRNRLLPLAQYQNLSRQVPVLYALLAVNATAVGWSYFRLAPWELAVGVPVLSVVLASWRVLHWAMVPSLQTDMLTLARKSIRRAEVFALIVGLAFTIWAIALDQYGGPFEHAHITLFVAITVVGCILCLTYAPRAARMVTYAVLGLYLPYCLVQCYRVNNGQNVQLLLVPISAEIV